MRGIIRTATGDIAPHELGRTDYHEHLFQVSPLLPGDDLDDESASAAEAASLARSGFDAMVDATPLGLGRRPAAIARIARASGLTVVLTTGVHRREHYLDDDPLLSLDAHDLHSAFLADLVEGASEPDGSRVGGVRAGLMKVGLGYWRIDALARRAIDAIGETHLVTGAPVMVHLEYATAAFEVLELLGAAGVPASAVALAHVDRAPDPVLHAELAAAGAYLGYDGAARTREWPESVLRDCLVRTAETGGRSRILLGGDVARRSRYRAYGGIPGLAYLGERFVPRLQAEAGEELVDEILRTNPARWLAWRTAR